MTLDDYTVQVLRVGKGSFSVLVIESGARGVCIQRIKPVTPELRRKINDSLFNAGSNPYQWQQTGWPVLSRLTPDNVRAASLESELRATYAYFKGNGEKPHLPTRLVDLVYFEPGSRAYRLLDDRVPEALHQDILTALEEVLTKSA